MGITVREKVKNPAFPIKIIITIMLSVLMRPFQLLRYYKRHQEKKIQDWTGTSIYSSMQQADYQWLARSMNARKCAHAQKPYPISP